MYMHETYTHSRVKLYEKSIKVILKLMEVIGFSVLKKKKKQDSIKNAHRHKPGAGGDGGFCDRGGPRDIVYSGNMGAIAPLRTANGALF